MKLLKVIFIALIFPAIFHNHASESQTPRSLEEIIGRISRGDTMLQLQSSMTLLHCGVMEQPLHSPHTLRDEQLFSIIPDIINPEIDAKGFAAYMQAVYERFPVRVGDTGFFVRAIENIRDYRRPFLIHHLSNPLWLNNWLNTTSRVMSDFNAGQLFTILWSLMALSIDLDRGWINNWCAASLSRIADFNYDNLVLSFLLFKKGGYAAPFEWTKAFKARIAWFLPQLSPQQLQAFAMNALILL